jgi:hypothetical protein
MERCDTCGNAYAKSFKVLVNGRDHTFDCFECAIAALAPICEHCNVRIIGHGVEQGHKIFCCAHCARMLNVEDLVDHIPQR